MCMENLQNYRKIGEEGMLLILFYYIFFLLPNYILSHFLLTLRRLFDNELQLMWLRWQEHLRNEILSVFTIFSTLQYRLEF